MVYSRIRDLRKDHDFSQAYVAECLGLYTTTYARYERGECEIPFDLAIAVARFYNVSLEYLAGISTIPQTLDGKPYHISKNITVENVSNSKINIKN